VSRQALAEAAKRSREEGVIVTRAAEATVTAMTLALAMCEKDWSPRPANNGYHLDVWESNNDRDTAQDRAGIGRIL
jgi:hypothetical protein